MLKDPTHRDLRAFRRLHLLVDGGDLAEKLPEDGHLKLLQEKEGALEQTGVRGITQNGILLLLWHHRLKPRPSRTRRQVMNSALKLMRWS